MDSNRRNKTRGISYVVLILTCSGCFPRKWTWRRGERRWRRRRNEPNMSNKDENFVCSSTSCSTVYPTIHKSCMAFWSRTGAWLRSVLRTLEHEGERNSFLYQAFWLESSHHQLSRWLSWTQRKVILHTLPSKRFIEGSREGVGEFGGNWGDSSAFLSTALLICHLSHPRPVVDSLLFY